MLFRRCRKVQLRWLSVYGDSRWPNNDGVDFESTSDIYVADSSFDVGDDGLVFSSGNTNPQRVPFLPQPPPPTKNVIVRRLRLRSHSSAIKFEAIFARNHSNVENMQFEDITIWNSSRGIGFQQRTGSGTIRNITFKNINIQTLFPTGSNWWGSGEPIWMTTIPETEAHDALTGSIEDISFAHIVAVGENSVLLSSLAKPMANIRFTNVSLTISKLGNCTCAKGNKSLPVGGCRDYRPLSSKSKKSVTYSNISAVVLEGEGSVVLDDVSLTFASPGQPYWTDKGIDVVVGSRWNITRRQ